MTNDHNRTVNRTIGAYYTPELTTKYMVEQTIPYITKKSKILDPACGDGIFLKEYLKHGISRKQLYAYDIDSKIKTIVRDYTNNIKITDSLKNLNGEYDVIIGNPPYSSNECDYIKKNREYLREIYYPIPPSNLYSLFLLNSIRHLKDGGILCFLVLDSFISNVYYKPLRDILLKDCKIKQIILAPRTLFHKSNADVRTAILLIQKCSDSEKRSKNTIKLIDRVEDESEYWNKSNVCNVQQSEFNKMSEYGFFINIPKNIIRLIVNSKKRLGDVLDGGTGISTGNDSIFLRKREHVKDNNKWVGYYKNGIRSPYYYKPTMFIEKNYKKNVRNASNYMIRNEKYFFREGITCSSVGVGFSAGYMPKNNLFGVNANFFTKNKLDLFYCLGLLNSQIAKYILKAVLNRTNNISSMYIKSLPYKEPEPQIKKHISAIVKNIVKNKQKNPNYDISEKQKYLDDLFYATYKISKKQQKIIEQFVNNIYNKL